MPNWRKSSYSGTMGEQDCVELADLTRAVGVRDSKTPEAGHLALSRPALAALATRIKAGDLDI